MKSFINKQTVKIEQQKKSEDETRLKQFLDVINTKKAILKKEFDQSQEIRKCEIKGTLSESQFDFKKLLNQMCDRNLSKEQQLDKSVKKFENFKQQNIPTISEIQSKIISDSQSPEQNQNSSYFSRPRYKAEIVESEALGNPYDVNSLLLYKKNLLEQINIIEQDIDKEKDYQLKRIAKFKELDREVIGLEKQINTVKQLHTATDNRFLNSQNVIFHSLKGEDISQQQLLNEVEKLDQLNKVREKYIQNIKLEYVHVNDINVNSQQYMAKILMEIQEAQALESNQRREMDQLIQQEIFLQDNLNNSRYTSYRITFFRAFIAIFLGQQVNQKLMEKIREGKIIQQPKKSANFQKFMTRTSQLSHSKTLALPSHKQGHKHINTPSHLNQDLGTPVSGSASNHPHKPKDQELSGFRHWAQNATDNSQHASSFNNIPINQGNLNRSESLLIHHNPIIGIGGVNADNLAGVQLTSLLKNLTKENLANQSETETPNIEEEVESNSDTSFLFNDDGEFINRSDFIRKLESFFSSLRGVSQRNSVASLSEDDQKVTRNLNKAFSDETIEKLLNIVVEKAIQVYQDLKYENQMLNEKYENFLQTKTIKSTELDLLVQEIIQLKKASKVDLLEEERKLLEERSPSSNSDNLQQLQLSVKEFSTLNMKLTVDRNEEIYQLNRKMVQTQFLISQFYMGWSELINKFCKMIILVKEIKESDPSVDNYQERFHEQLLGISLKTAIFIDSEWNAGQLVNDESEDGKDRKESNQTQQQSFGHITFDNYDDMLSDNSSPSFSPQMKKRAIERKKSQLFSENYASKIKRKLTKSFLNEGEEIHTNPFKYQKISYIYIRDAVQSIFSNSYSEDVEDDAHSKLRNDLVKEIIKQCKARVSVWSYCTEKLFNQFIENVKHKINDLYYRGGSYLKIKGSSEETMSPTSITITADQINLFKQLFTEGLEILEDTIFKIILSNFQILFTNYNLILTKLSEANKYIFYYLQVKFPRDFYEPVSNKAEDQIHYFRTTKNDFIQNAHNQVANRLQIKYNPHLIPDESDHVKQNAEFEEKTYIRVEQNKELERQRNFEKLMNHIKNRQIQNAEIGILKEEVESDLKQQQHQSEIHVNPHLYEQQLFLQNRKSVKQPEAEEDQNNFFDTLKDEIQDQIHKNPQIIKHFGKTMSTPALMNIKQSVDGFSKMPSTAQNDEEIINQSQQEEIIQPKKAFEQLYNYQHNSKGKQLVELSQSATILSKIDKLHQNFDQKDNSKNILHNENTQREHTMLLREMSSRSHSYMKPNRAYFLRKELSQQTINNIKNQSTLGNCYLLNFTKQSQNLSMTSTTYLDKQRSDSHEANSAQNTTRNLFNFISDANQKKPLASTFISKLSITENNNALSYQSPYSSRSTKFVGSNINTHVSAYDNDISNSRRMVTSQRMRTQDWSADGRPQTVCQTQNGFNQFFNKRDILYDKYNVERPRTMHKIGRTIEKIATPNVFEDLYI